MSESHPLWRQGCELFNAGEYWEAHEALEPLWLEASDTRKHFYGGIILLAAALHKARQMDSARGGRRNYAKALVHLATVPDVYFGIQVRHLELEVHRALLEPQLNPQLQVPDMRE